VNDEIHNKEQTMAHQADSSVIETVVQLLCENGLSHMADAMRLMLNGAMRIERSQALEQAADITGNHAVGVLLETCLADKLALVERARRLIRARIRERVAERLGATV